MVLRRSGEIKELTLQLPAGWRRRDDPSWRVAAWGIGRMMTGGMRLKPLTDEEHRPGDKVPVTFLRDGKKQTLTLPIQK